MLSKLFMDMKIQNVEKLLKKKFKNLDKYRNDVPSDQPNRNFMGPF